MSLALRLTNDCDCALLRIRADNPMKPVEQREAWTRQRQNLGYIVTALG